MFDDFHSPGGLVLDPEPLGNTAAQADDYEWALRDPEVRRRYDGKVVAVHRRKVWGAGRTYDAAWEAACRQPDCPSPDEIVFVIV
jgi:hypothetical protein